MGEVYRARDSRLAREVALKVLPAARAQSQSSLTRFEREARAAGSLNHPNIVAIYDVGADGGVPYLVTELLDGETLHELLARGPIPLETALDQAGQIADGLAAAHEGGIVHRDLKTQNLFVTRAGRVKILDFGVAKMMAEGRTESSPPSTVTDGITELEDLTASGAVIGTLGYMSPEQVRGQAADARSDIFSFGAVAYEMVTGARAFRAATPAETAAAILKDTPPPMPQAPRELERIVSRCLAKRPEDRFQSARELCVALGALRSPAASAGRSGRRAIGRPLGALFLALAGLAAVAATIRVGRSCSSAGESPAGTEVAPIETIAVLPFVNAAADPEIDYLCDGITDSVIHNLSRVRQLRVLARGTVLPYKGRQLPPQQAGRELGVRKVLVGRVFRRGGGLVIASELVEVAGGQKLWGKEYDTERSDLLAVQRDIARAIAETIPLRLTGAEKERLRKQDTDNTGAYQLYLKGEYLRRRGTLYLAGSAFGRLPDDLHQIEQYYKQAIALDPSYALAHSGLMHFYGFAASRGLLPPDETWPKAQAVAIRSVELDPSLQSSYLHLLAAIAFTYQRDWRTSDRAFRRALDLNPNDAEVGQHHATCLAVLGRFDDAMAEIRRTEQIDPFAPGFFPASGAAPLVILFWARRPDELIERARLRTARNARDAFAHEMMGNAYEQKGQHAEALAAWRKVMILSGDDELAAILDRAALESGYPGVVRAVWQKRLERLTRQLERGEYVAAGRFARVHAKLGHVEQALAWLEKAFEEPTRLVLEVGVDPVFDGLRGDPRFADFVRRVRLALDPPP